ncbi:hypothetical protein PTSG_09913 [Salpingoeca rosetta]|uniref:Uncharacterized protein n=1 Tax=Salpingoeca rosetta (strain ATCC 50818 / BSB-021) TaxID=946362 RepID=F2UNH8_SALR5|nr:uncharacterized protein PTSG_09913 [Salpingoeca rosetta]EGD79183.1 hypothetical protein PTSG_09913 [Salpingoeca rosetta]|eukprot:XP_004989268.1 hypothetical protein PTSG_09913 [Salpingoeca rosetta]
MSSAVQFLRANKALLPLAACVALGTAMASGHILRRALSDHTLAWTREKTYPWNNIKSTQNTKLLGLQGDYKHEEVFKPQSADDLRGKL